MRRFIREARAERSAQASHDEQRSFELAATARDFTRKTRDLVEDKLTFSATLMRAGEVDAARRILAEVEREVLTEEAALFERVNELRLSPQPARSAATKVRSKAASAAVALLAGTGLLGLSAAGAAAVAAFRHAHTAVIAPLAERNRHHGSASRHVSSAGDKHRLVHKTIGGVRLTLNTQQLKTLDRLTTSNDNQGLTAFLNTILPAPIAQRVHDVLVAAAPVTKTVEPPAVSAIAFGKKTVKHKVRHASDKKPDASPSPSSDASPSPSGDPSPSPSSSQKDRSSRSGSDGSSSGSGSGGGGGIVPVPLPHDQPHL